MCLLHLPCSENTIHFLGRFVPESGPAKRFLIGTKRLMPFGQLFTLLCRNHERGRKSMPLNGLLESRYHEIQKHGFKSGFNFSVVYFPIGMLKVFLTRCGTILIFKGSGVLTKIKIV